MIHSNICLKFCPNHDQQLQRALTSRSLSEFGWRTDEERKEALNQQLRGHYSRTNFNPFVTARCAIFEFAAEKLGDRANGCPVCLMSLLGDNDLIERTAQNIADIIKKLPDA
jgi:hypothetical protein